VPVDKSLVWYLRNDETVDTGTGIDVRVMRDSSSTADSSQTWTSTNSQQGQFRVFDPATLGSNTNTDPFNVFTGRGWAIRPADSLPDDPRCKLLVPAQMYRVNAVMALEWSGSPVGDITIQCRVALCRYNPTTNTGSIIAASAGSFPSWNALGSPESGTQQSVAPQISVPTTVLERDEVLMLQVGVRLTTTPGPLLGGTVTYTGRLFIGGPSATRMDMEISDLPFQQQCYVSDGSDGSGAADRELVIVRALKQADAAAAGSKNLLVVRAQRDASAGGAADRTLRLRHGDALLGEGHAARALTVSHDQGAQAPAFTHKELLVRRSAEDVPGTGVSDFSREWDAYRYAARQGTGETTFSRTVIFVRSATANAVGEVDPNEARIALPIADLPAAGDGGTVNIRKIFPIFD
jgi:hypothetical protein